MRYVSTDILKYFFREVSSIVSRSNEKVKDKYFWTNSELNEAQQSLFFLQASVKKTGEFKKIFGNITECSQIKPFKKGFNMKTVVFTTPIQNGEKKWVLKIGHRISPVIDFGDPSEYTYYKKQRRYYTVLKKNIPKILTHLIPQPQCILWEKENRYRSYGTTLILQPFLQVISARRAQFLLSAEEKLILLQELLAFRRLLAKLLERYNLQPDLFGEGNLEIAKINHEYHFVLLDCGLVDMRMPLPLTHTIMYFSKETLLSQYEEILHKSTF